MPRSPQSPLDSNEVFGGTPYYQTHRKGNNVQSSERNENIRIVLAILAALFLLFGGVGGCMWGYPQYKVYSARLSGEAVLAEAEASRQVAVKEALALRDAAEHKANAEIKRAHGVAEANKIIGNSLQGNDEYLRYLYIDGMHNTRNQVIYVPTEAGLPIMEASRFAPKPQAVQK